MTKKKNFLVYCGSPGIGKTYLCAALIEFALLNFDSFRYWKEQDLLTRVRASIEEYKGDYLDTLKQLLDDDLIFIDDIGSSGVNQWREEIFFAAIDQRYNSMKPTVITSNFTVEQMKKIYHPRVSSRLFSHDSIVIEILDGVDLRSQGE